MTFIDRLKFVFQKEAPTPTKIPSPYYEMETYGYDSVSSGKQKEYLEEMKGWVAACVCSISDEIAATDIRLYKFDKEGNVEEVDEHEVLDLLYKVNEYTTRFDHLWISQAYLELTGECPWFLERGAGGKIEQLYFLMPSRIQPIADKERVISGYKYDIGKGQTVTIPPEDIIFLKYPNPAKPFRGIGTLEMAARTVDLDNFSEEWNKGFYENSAHPDSVLSVKVDQMDKEQKAKLKASLKENYTGVRKAHETMILFGDMKLEKFGLTQKDMDFLEQQRFSRDKILGIFRVPKAIVAQTEGVNFASADVAQYVFARWTIAPKLERLVQQLNEFLLPQFSGTEMMFLDYDNPVPEDQAKKLAYWQGGLSSGFLTINEVRSEQGLEAVEGGDSIYLPFSLMPIGSNSQVPDGSAGVKEFKLKEPGKKKPLSSPRFQKRIHEAKARSRRYFNIQKKIEETTKEIKEQIKKGIYAEIKLKNEILDAPRKILSDEEKLKIWQGKNELFRKYFPKVRGKMITLFQEQRKETMPKLDRFKALKFDSGSIFDSIKLDPGKEEKRTLKLVLPLLNELFGVSGDKTFADLGVDMTMDLTRAEIQQILGIAGKKFAKVVTDETNDQIWQAIQTSIAEGESIDDMSKRVKDVFIGAEEYRSDRIARTETLRYNTGATEQAFIDSGVVEAKEWFCNPDACEQCLEFRGQVVDLGENFLDKGGDVNGVVYDYADVPAPPLHPNCECDLVPVLLPEKNLRLEDNK